MHRNETDYWRYLQSLQASDPDLPRPRVCRLLQGAFARWRRKPRWIREEQVGHLFLNRPDLKTTEVAKLAALPLIVRKAHAIDRMLRIVTDPEVAQQADTFHVLPDELIVGTLPPFSVGQGKEFVRYLTEEEALAGELEYLNETSPMGHIVPDYGKILKLGLNGVITECRQRRKKVRAAEKTFYEAVILSLEAVKAYAAAYAKRIEETANALQSVDPYQNKKSLATVAANLRRVPAETPQTFHQAVQAVYLLHCAFHWTVEIVPFGRLDQLLWPFLHADLGAGRITLEDAQEIVECFWIKLDEKVIRDRRLAEDRFNSCDGTLTGFYGASNFDQGGLLNQWMQQVTIGGVVANDDPEPTDASNTLTLIFLEAARRLPLNSPTLDLRVHPGTDARVLELAASALLSGGAHPVLLNDTHIIKALETNTQCKVPRSSLRNYACDGCYETMFAGETEFSFGFIFALDAIERTLNRGAKFGASGGMNLRGIKDSWRTAPVSAIPDIVTFRSILKKHILLACHRYLRDLTRYYGNKLSIPPSPLLSAFISGCLETGRDLNNAGARYHLFSPLIVGVSNAADSLYAIEERVFRRGDFTLEELRAALASNWGQKEPGVGPFLPKTRIDEIRALCCDLPKFGAGDAEVDRLAWDLIDLFLASVEEARNHPLHINALAELQARYDYPSHPFEIFLAPGVGTFEQYVGLGGISGASADGRPAFSPIASDLSPAPIHEDEPATLVDDGGKIRHRRSVKLTSALASYRSSCLNQLGDGAPCDFNLAEDFPHAALVEILGAFARGDGPSVATFTVANPETLARAAEVPDDYNLVRVRMGGWTEFFITLFPTHQNQHQRRPLFVT